jgi:hypothetical protein
MPKKAPEPPITQETMDAIVDELSARGLSMEDVITPFDENPEAPLSEYTEAAGLGLLEEIKAAPAPGDPQVPEYGDAEVTSIKETLKVPLTDADYKEYAIRIGQVGTEITQAEDGLAAVKSQFKARIDAATAKRNEYSAIINAGCEYKPVECHLIKDYQANAIVVVRLDTGEVVRERTMSIEERQRGLFVAEPESEGNAEASTE